ncbi:MAG: helix-turn-helix transcriptional regulator [Solirubrobacterales bacterium]
MERGARVPRIDTLVKVAAALDVDPAELLEGINWEPGEITVGQFIETEIPGLGIVHRRFGVERKS